MTLDTAKQIIGPVYDALTKPGTKKVEALLSESLSIDWISYGSAGSKKTRTEFIQMVSGFGKLIPDLTFKIDEIIVGEGKIVVRSEATGTPAADFMGVPHSSRSFKIMAIDIHTIKNGKSVEVHHVEDWMTAVRQLSGK